MAYHEIRVSGFGGQGVILTGMIIGKAASIFEGKFGTMTQAFGPEARGAACSSQVIVSDDRILYPYVRETDLLICMSQEAWTRFSPGAKAGSIICIDEDLVKCEPPRDDCKIFRVPSTRFAEKDLGRKIVLNIVMTGFFTAVTKVTSKKSMLDSVVDSVPKRTIELNTKAFNMGFEHGEKALAAV